MKDNKYVRKVEGFSWPYWCDYCRLFTLEPMKHAHEEARKR